VITLETKISKQYRDLIQKHVSGLFRDSALEFYGIKTAKIVELINVELPDIVVKGSSTDFIFLLEDNTYLHLEFQTTYNIDDLIRFAGYDLRLYARDGRKIVTVVIYIADVEEADVELDVGSMVYRPEKVMMIDYDGNIIYQDLCMKINTGLDLTDEDILNLIFLPLMKHTIPRDELARNSVELANTIQDKTKRDLCLAAVFAFASKYLNKSEMEKLKEVVRMTDLVDMIVEEAVEKKEIEIIKNMLRLNQPIENIARFLMIDEDTIVKLKNELDEEYDKNENGRL